MFEFIHFDPPTPRPESVFKVKPGLQSCIIFHLAHIVFHLEMEKYRTSQTQQGSLVTPARGKLQDLWILQRVSTSGWIMWRQTEDGALTRFSLVFSSVCLISKADEKNSDVCPVNTAVSVSLLNAWSRGELILRTSIV